uniref:Persimmon protein WRKY6 n=1 Tax=Diospyros kaki TaxID=35925 RepID=A0A3G5BMJ3_DIOKA|nr:persimmon protein WRKY6 [Diospyros kaki]
MDGSHSEELKPENQASKRRKVVQKTVVRVKIEANEGKQRSEGPPSDCWSWRKYGQKPIKGSPYPRGYYRCSTSKGCSAKKQVERCRTDASTLVITYTSSHNHPGPDLPSTSKLTGQDSVNEQEEADQPTEDLPVSPKKEEEQPPEQQASLVVNSDEDEKEEEDHFHYSQSPFNNSQDIIIGQRENPFEESLDDSPKTVLLDEEPLSCSSPLMTLSALKSEENDHFYDELEELPSFSSFTSFLGSSIFDERILILPS